MYYSTLSITIQNLTDVLVQNQVETNFHYRSSENYLPPFLAAHDFTFSNNENAHEFMKVVKVHLTEQAAGEVVHFCHLDKAKYMHFNMPKTT